MSLVFVEGYENLTNGSNDLFKKWGAPVTATAQNFLSPGRFGAGSYATLNIAGAGVGGFPADTTIIGQTAFWYATDPNITIFEIWDSAGTVQGSFAAINGSPLCSIRYYRGEFTNQVMDTGPVFSKNTAAPDWHYFGFFVFLDPTNGRIKIWVDGVLVYDQSGLNTRGGLAAGAVSAKFQCSTWGTNFDDSIIMTGSAGAPFNDYIGDHRIYGFRPISDVQTNFNTVFPASPTTHYDKVDDTAHDDDTTYIASPDVGDVDTWGYQQATGANNIKAMVITTVARKDNTGAKKIAPVITGSDSTDYPQSDMVLSDSYGFNKQIVLADPVTAAAWTQAGFNAAKFGVKVTA